MENPDKFLEPTGYRGHSVGVKVVWLFLSIGQLPTPQPCEYTFVYIISEYILGIGLQTTAGEFCLQVQVVKTILQGHAKHPSIQVSSSQQVMLVNQYRLPGARDEITATIGELWCVLPCWSWRF